jgi:uncharacterized protein YhhL (DUF1145 family)
MTAPKIVTLLIWLGLAASFFIPGEANWIGWCQIAFGVLAATHFIEFLLYIPILRKSGSMVAHLVQVMLFGYFYYQEIKAQDTKPAEPGQA